MNIGKVWCGVFIVVVLAGFGRPAHAQSETQKKQEAKALCEKAARFYDLGKYDEAIQEYEAAYLLVPDANLLYNIGQAYRLGDKPEEAIRSYKNYLRNRADAPNRAEVEKRIAELEQLGDGHRRPGIAPPAPPPPVSGITPAPASTEPAAPPVVEPAPAVPPSAAAAPPPPVQPAPPAVEKGPSWFSENSRLISITLFIAGGACVATSLVTGLVAASKAKQIADDSKKPNHPVFDPSVQSSGKTFNTIAIVTGVTGLAVGGLGLYFYLRSGRESGAAAPDSSRAQMTLFPLAGPGFAGGGASINF
jgi:hypothetical protein